MAIYREVSPKVFLESINGKFSKASNDTFLFLQGDLNDSLGIYNNQMKLISTRPINAQKGEKWQIISITPCRKNIMTVIDYDTKTKIRFHLDKKYPLYTIQKYDDVWYVNGRLGLVTK